MFQGQREIFEQDYRKERIHQARLAFEWQRANTTIVRICFYYALNYYVF